MATKKGEFPRSVVRKLMRDAGATLVAKESIELMCALIESYVKSTTGKALVFMEHGKRKILSAKDLELTQLKE